MSTALPPIGDRVSPHFTWREVVRSQTAARLGLANVPTLKQCAQIEVAALGMEAVRACLGVAVWVSSWFRAPVVNRSAGGAKGSDHQEGWAIDFEAPDFGSPAEVVAAIRSSGIRFHKLILEFPESPGGGWVHISFNPLLAGQVLVTNDGVRYDALA